jgi:hypothetical protein
MNVMERKNPSAAQWKMLVDGESLVATFIVLLLFTLNVHLAAAGVASIAIGSSRYRIVVAGLVRT